MEKGEKLVIVGCSGAGGPAAMMAKNLMPEVDVTVIRKEEFFILTNVRERDNHDRIGKVERRSYRTPYTVSSH